MKLVFSDLAWDQYLHWVEADPKTFAKLNTLINEVRRSPSPAGVSPSP